MSWRNRVEVSYHALQYNVRLIAQAAGEQALIAVIKADAYGLGAARCARIFVEAGVAGLAVATLGEAQRVAAAVPGSRIMLLGSPLPEERPGVVAGGFDVWVSNADEIAAFAALGSEQQPARLHRAIDTGMGRSGCPPDQAISLAQMIRAQTGCRLLGLATHYPEALDPLFSASQEDCFDAIVAALAPFESDVWIHRANSEGLIARPGGPCNALRVGLLLSGIAAESLPQGRLCPAIRWVSSIALVKELPAGHSVSYQRNHILERDSRLALIPVGYADGYPFQCLGSGAQVLIHGQRCPLLGRVTMDYLIVDVSDCRDQPEVGDEVVLIGQQGEDEISVIELAQWAGSIPYDILCGFRGRCEILGVS